MIRIKGTDSLILGAHVRSMDVSDHKGHTVLHLQNGSHYEVRAGWRRASFAIESPNLELLAVECAYTGNGDAYGMSMLRGAWRRPKSI